MTQQPNFEQRYFDKCFENIELGMEGMKSELNSSIKILAQSVQTLVESQKNQDTNILEMQDNIRILNEKHNTCVIDQVNREVLKLKKDTAPTRYLTYTIRFVYRNAKTVGWVLGGILLIFTAEKGITFFEWVKKMSGL